MAVQKTGSGTKSGPSWRPQSWESDHVPMWQKVDDFYKQLRSAGAVPRYLHQAVGERNNSFQDRLDTISVDDDLRQAIKSNAGLLSDIHVKEGSPEALKDDKTNVDRQGSNLNQFVLKVISAALKNECVLLGCHLDKDGENRQPYFSCLDICTEVFSPLVTLVNGEKVLSRVSIKSHEQVPSDDPDDFAVKDLVIYTVYRWSGDTGVTVERYRKEEKGWMGEGRAPITKIDGSQLDKIPFVWLGVDPESKVGEPQTPPYYSMVCKLIRLLNMESELDAVQRKVNIPIPTEETPTADVSESPAKDLVLGTDHVWRHGKDTKVGFAEPKGTAMSISHTRILALKDEIKAEKDKFIGLDDAQTATAVNIDSGQTRMSLNSIATAVESAFEELFKLYSGFSERYREGDDSGGIEIHMNSIKPPVTLQDLQAVITVLESSLATDYEGRAKLFSLGWLTDEVLESAKQMEEQGDLDLVRANFDLSTNRNVELA